MRIFFVFALIGYGVYWLVTAIQSAPNAEQFRDLLEMYKWPAIIAVIAIVLRQFTTEKEIMRSLGYLTLHTRRTHPVNNDP